MTSPRCSVADTQDTDAQQKPTNAHGPNRSTLPCMPILLPLCLPPFASGLLFHPPMMLGARRGRSSSTPVPVASNAGSPCPRATITTQNVAQDARSVPGRADAAGHPSIHPAAAWNVPARGSCRSLTNRLYAAFISHKHSRRRTPAGRRVAFASPCDWPRMGATGRTRGRCRRSFHAVHHGTMESSPTPTRRR